MGLLRYRKTGWSALCRRKIAQYQYQWHLYGETISSNLSARLARRLEALQRHGICFDQGKWEYTPIDENRIILRDMGRPVRIQIFQPITVTDAEVIWWLAVYSDIINKSHRPSWLGPVSLLSLKIWNRLDDRSGVRRYLHFSITWQARILQLTSI